MKKFIFSLVVMMATVFSANAQNYATSNYVGSSKFTDNWSITLQGGILTTAESFCAGNTAMAPIVVLGVDKYVNKWLGFGFEGRTMIGTGKVNESRFNSKCAFEAFNLNGYVKLNVLNIFGYSGQRKMFEPVLYTGLGWNHICTSEVPDATNTTSQMARNAMLYRVGADFTFNLGRTKSWGLMISPSIMWSNVNNMRFRKQNCDIELTAGIVYHFKTSNGTHGFAKAKLYDQAEIDALNAKIAELQNQPAKVVEKRVEVPATNAVASTATSYVVTFAQGSSELTPESKATLDKLGQNAVVDVVAATSPEGTTIVNYRLSQARAEAVKAYLESRGLKVASAKGGEAGRIAVVSIAK